MGVFAKRAEAPENGGVPVVASFERERRYSDTSFSPVQVYATPAYPVLLTYIKEGQFIPVHTPHIDLFFVVQSSRGTVVAVSERRSISLGYVIIVPRGIGCGILAGTDMEAQHPGDLD